MMLGNHSYNLDFVTEKFWLRFKGQHFVRFNIDIAGDIRKEILPSLEETIYH